MVRRVNQNCMVFGEDDAVKCMIWWRSCLFRRRTCGGACLPRAGIA